jgi:hypothetical protein
MEYLHTEYIRDEALEKAHTHTLTHDIDIDISWQNNNNNYETYTV